MKLNIFDRIIIKLDKLLVKMVLNILSKTIKKCPICKHVYTKHYFRKGFKFYKEEGCVNPKCVNYINSPEKILNKKINLL